MKNYIDLYEESLKKNLVELNQKLLNAENENDLIENKGYIKFQLTNQILNYKNSLERLRNSSLVILIRNENNNDINFKDRNIKGLSNLFYTSEISKEIDYNYGLLSIMIFISLLITFILSLITYLNFLEYRSKN